MVGHWQKAWALLCHLVLLFYSTMYHRFPLHVVAHSLVAFDRYNNMEHGIWYPRLKSKTKEPVIN